MNLAVSVIISLSWLLLVPHPSASVEITWYQENTNVTDLGLVETPEIAATAVIPRPGREGQKPPPISSKDRHPNYGWEHQESHHKEALHPTWVKRGINGGFPCAACTVLIGMGEQLAQINNVSVTDGLDQLCGYLPQETARTCTMLVYTLGPHLLDLLVYGTSPDMVCYILDLCVVDPGKTTCHLFPTPKKFPDFEDVTQAEITSLKAKFKKTRLTKSQLADISSLLEWAAPWVCYIPGVKQLCEALESAYSKLVPAIDIDKDGHSPVDELRGALWRGRDCDDKDGGVHPGRRPRNSDRDQDSNCNGISGVNPRSGLAWEEEMCGGSGARGVVYLGDSVGGHFHIPPQWFSPLEIHDKTFTNLTYVVSNEADWPDVGFATGFRNTSWSQTVGGTDSIYLRMAERNRCNHRDYHNLARNGANSNDTMVYMQSLARQPRDLPALVFYSLVGNDICVEAPEPERMTRPDQFYENTMTTLRFLEEHLAPDSHIVLVGLINADFLYDTMAQRYHPVGQYGKNVKYKDVYRWFNCMEIGPCAGWMTPNKTLRAITTKRSRDLSKVLENIAENEKFSKFDLFYMDNPLSVVVKEWVEGGGELHELIEPVDSLHPTQVAQPLIAEYVWDKLLKEVPHFLGPVNKYNDVIQKLFGDQGGY